MLPLRSGRRTTKGPARRALVECGAVELRGNQDAVAATVLRGTLVHVGELSPLA